MKKPKPVKKKAASAPPSLTDEELASGDWVECKPARLPPNLRSINGIDLPADLDETLSDYALDAALMLQQSEMDALGAAQQFPPEFTNIDYAEWQLRQFESNGEAVRSRFDTIYACCLHAVRQGFFAALTRYSGELKGTAEAKVLEKARASAAKASAAKSKKAAPRREAIRARYLELKKTKSKKTNRLTTLEAEFKVSSRHLQRIVKGLD